MESRVHSCTRAWASIVYLGLLLVALSPSHVAADASRGRSPPETFTEDLLLRPLPDGNIMQHFLMQTTWPLPEGWDQGSGERARGGQHYQVFPKAIGEMVQMYGVGEFHLSFAHGQWLWQRWGHPPVSAPGGLSLWAWFLPLDGAKGGGEEVTEALRKAWLGLSNALSGLFGASISLLASPLRHTHPSSSLRPTSSLLRSLWGAQPPSSHLFYGSLPREVSCTENLTPWIKLLPCRDRAGLSRLIRPPVLCGALYTSYTAHVSIECGQKLADGTCAEGGGHVVRYTQSITSVTNALLGLLSTSNSRRSSVRAMPPIGAAAFTLSQLLAPANSSNAVAGCALADASAIHLHQPAHWRRDEEFSVKVGGEHGGMEKRDLGPGEGVLWTIDVSARGATKPVGVSLDCKWQMMSPASLAASGGSSYVTAHRIKSGLQTDRGSLVLDLWNHHPHAAISVHLLDTLPWFIRLYLHTLRVVVNETVVEPARALEEGHVELGGIRQGMTRLQLQLTLPPASRSRVALDFEKAFLHIDEFPPDANRGFDLPSPIISYAPPPHPTRPPPPLRLEADVACSGLSEALVTGKLGDNETCTHEGLRYTCINHPQVFLYQALPSQQVQRVACLLDEEFATLCASPDSFLCIPRLDEPLTVSQALLGLRWASALRARGVGAEAEDEKEEVVLYGESVLLQFPTPDVSMPYNVITLSCTVLALFFGSVFNMLTRRLRPVKKKKEVEKDKKDALLKRLFGKLMGTQASPAPVVESPGPEGVGEEEEDRRRRQQQEMMQEVLAKAVVRVRSSE